jgi:hypothetical protein
MLFICCKTCIFASSYKSILIWQNLIQGTPTKSHRAFFVFLISGIINCVFKILKNEKGISFSYGCFCNKRICY